MDKLQIESNIMAIQRFAALIQANRSELIELTTEANWIPSRTNAEQIQRGIATLEHFHLNSEQLADRQSLGGIALFSSYNDPLYATLGMSLGAALLVNGCSLPIVLKFPQMLEKLSLALQRIIVGSGQFPNIAFSRLNGADFMEHYFADSTCGVIQVYGGNWVNRYVEHPARYGTALRFEGPGNNPAIVHVTANLEEAIENIATMGFVMAGQACVVPRRILVDDRVPAKKFKDLLYQKVESIVVSDDPHGDAHVGPIKNPAVIARLKAQHEEAIRRGATAFNWSSREVRVKDDHGVLFTPTIFTDVDHSMQIVAEESFGPAVTLMRAKSDRLIELANATAYKLAASVFGDPACITSYVDQLRQSHGMVMVNQTAKDIVSLQEGYIGPWGGYGISAFYIGPDQNWSIQRGAMSMVGNFSREIRNNS